MISPVAALSGLPDESWVLRAVRFSATEASSELPEAASLSSQSPIMGNAASIPSRSTPPCKDAIVESRAVPTLFDSTSLLSARCLLLTSPVLVLRALPPRYGAPLRTESGQPNRHGFPEVTRGYPTSTPSGKETNGRTREPLVRQTTGRRPLRKGANPARAGFTGFGDRFEEARGISFVLGSVCNRIFATGAPRYLASPGSFRLASTESRVPFESSQAQACAAVGLPGVASGIRASSGIRSTGSPEAASVRPLQLNNEMSAVASYTPRSSQPTARKSSISESSVILGFLCHLPGIAHSPASPGSSYPDRTGAGWLRTSRLPAGRSRSVSRSKGLVSWRCPVVQTKGISCPPPS